MVLGDEGDASLAPAIVALARHDNLHVREATLATLCKLQGAEAEAHFLRALEDPQAGVRAMAVVCLGEIRSDHRATWDFYAAAFGNAGHEPEDDAVLVKVCQALAHLEEGPAQGFGEAEAILLEALRPVQPKGVLSRLKRASPRFSPPVLEAICDALGAVGSLDAVEPLRELSESAPEVAERAASTADRIERQHAEAGTAVG
jgi:HEAT repeat protein